MSFIDFIQDIGTYETRKINRVEREENGGIGVSTAFTSDEGYETALLDKNGVHPVERYTNKKAAQTGHTKWVDFAKTANGKQIKSLGWSSMNLDETITLEGV
jgi:hypothetical protein